MDKDRVAGSAKVAKGEIKQAVGRVIGDARLETAGKADEFKGKVQKMMGRLKNTLKGT